MTSAHDVTTSPQAEGIVSKASPYSLAETLARLERAIAARGLTLFAHIDHSGEAERAGLTMQPAHVLIFGSPKAGTPLMRVSPLLALDLPLKVLTWMDDSGRVWVSYATPSYLGARYSLPDDLVRNLAGIAAITDEVVAQ